MKNIINLSLLSIKRDKSKIKIYIIILTIFITLINILLNTSIILTDSINNIYINVDYEMITTVKYIVNSLITFIIVLTFILINILLKQSINDKFFDIAIYKSVGYKDKYIFQLLFYELFIITTISYLFSIIPSFIGINAINLIFSKFNIHNSFINIIYVYLIPLIIIYFIIYISSFNALRKAKKIQISTLFREK
ncbi:FtsX-like permease family [Clostridioides difficile]|uniref:FtsX-like permease family protein n=3 Tax=Clostridioides difficile TaxID=1496 RepID=UPI001024E8D1|nr:FtsX-like permease family protein [Clostridioides difficile]UWD40737.1 FtsX-like permease family protein [Clostridioides difficile]UWD44524.1 FtsX-like permease family protein [Clostridioides difficile]VFF94173.1 FtsX-like permease family [Clostridioides difficile]VIF92681.1 FtsX-like permease family [Clostridioides difficile]VIF99108.1 FtsX-like permease family [Clostridioides difficile]